jgi:hypothetical protein
MKNYLCCLFLIILVLVGQVYAQNIIQPDKNNLDFPEVPRISAFEAYQKYKAGKAILVQAGGEGYERRHILGAHDVNGEKVGQGQIPLPNFPMRGLEIYTYCY